MPYEDTQDGNPHELTKNQHIFPDSCIKRFVNANGDVEVYKKAYNKVSLKKPSSTVFCAKRVWDQKAESGLIKGIEDEYKRVAVIMIGRRSALNDPKENATIEDFFALWCFRARHNSNPLPDQQLQGIDGTSQTFTKDEEEIMEKAGVAFIRPDGTIPSRIFTGDRILLQLIDWRNRYKGHQWGLLQASKGEFIVPDDPTNGYSRIIPLTPELCLASPTPDVVITEQEVRKINRLAIQSSREYYFARDLSRCAQ